MKSAWCGLDSPDHRDAAEELDSLSLNLLYSSAVLRSAWPRIPVSCSS